MPMLAVEKEYAFEGPDGLASLLDLFLTALGRQEEWEDSPEGYPRTPPYRWWNLHDEYGDAA